MHCSDRSGTFVWVARGQGTRRHKCDGLLLRDFVAYLPPPATLPGGNPELLSTSSVDLIHRRPCQHAAGRGQLGLIPYGRCHHGPALNATACHFSGKATATGDLTFLLIPLKFSLKFPLFQPCLIDNELAGEAEVLLRSRFHAHSSSPLPPPTSPRGHAKGVQYTALPGLQTKPLITMQLNATLSSKSPPCAQRTPESCC